MDKPQARRGRPRLDPTGRPVSPVQVKFSAADYEAIAKVANSRRESRQDVIRAAVRREISIIKL